MGQPAKQSHSASNPVDVSPDNAPITPTHPSGMREWRLLTIGAVFIAVVGLIILCASVLRQRTYNGKPESYWINSLARPLSTTSVTKGIVEFLEDQEEWRALGPKGVPILLKALEIQPGPATKPYAKLWHKLPATWQKRLPPPMDYGRLHSSAWNKLALAYLKTNVAVPPKLVARALKDQDWTVRYSALECLNLAVLPQSGAEKVQFLPSLLRAAEDPQMEARAIALLCLGHYRSQSTVLIPILSNALANPYPDVRLRAAMSLYRVDPAAAENARVKDVAYDCLRSSRSSRLDDVATRYGPGVSLPSAPVTLARQFLKELEKALANERTHSTNPAPPLP